MPSLSHMHVMFACTSSEDSKKHIVTSVVLFSAQEVCQAPRKMTWRERILTIEALPLWLAVWFSDPSEVIRDLFSMRRGLWSVPNSAFVLLTPFRIHDNVYAWLHIVSMDTGIGQTFTHWTWFEPMFVGSYFDLL